MKLNKALRQAPIDSVRHARVPGMRHGWTAALRRPQLRLLCIVLMTAAGLGMAACTGQAKRHRSYCELEPGMNTDQLAACGCLLNKTGSLRSAPESRDRGGTNMQTVIIVNYLCPLGEQGVAFVSVHNGIADAVYY